LFFSEDRIKNAIQKLIKGRHTSTQGRIDAFFTSAGTVSSQPTSAKRKVDLFFCLHFNGCEKSEYYLGQTEMHLNIHLLVYFQADDAKAKGPVKRKPAIRGGKAK
jgi:hypothetical protein